MLRKKSKLGKIQRVKKGFIPPNAEWTHEIENEDVVPKTRINYFMEYFSNNIF